jgi:methylthioribulose-1-phosphate dehydratase
MDALKHHRRSAKKLLCKLLRSFYRQGWVSGTGGGISLRVPGGFLMAPSGVAKELVRPEDVFELDETFRVTNAHGLSEKLKLTECAPLFQAIYERCGAGAVIHSHSVRMVLAMRRAKLDELTWESLEMVKGIRGACYPEEHRAPIIPNTPRECDLLSSLEHALERLPQNAHAVFVRDHGAYIWGNDAMEAKRHAEIYDWLCELTNGLAMFEGTGDRR